MQERDCVVIGAGMSGLTFAALMAQAKKSVVALEEHYVPGGLFTAFTRERYTFNVAMEWTTECGQGEGFHTILRRVGLDESYPFRKIDLFKTVLSPELAEPLHLYCSQERLTRHLVRAFPREQGNIERFVDDCVMLVTDPSKAKTILLRSGVKSVEEMLEQYFDDELLIHVLYAVLAYPQARGVLLMYLIASMCLGKIYYPEHRDHRRLPGLLHQKTKRSGGEIRYSTRVEEILERDGSAYGVRLADGEEIHAPLVVASIDGVQLHERLLRKRHVGSDHYRQFTTRKSGLSIFGLFLGVEGELGLDSAPTHAYVVLAPTKTWRERKHEIAGAPLRMECQSVAQPKLAPSGRSTICAWATSDIADYQYWGQGRDCDYDALDRASYDRAKATASDILLERLEPIFRDLRARIEVVETATPFTVKRYTRSHAGSVSGHSLTELSYLKWGTSATPVRGLYHIGQWTAQSGVGAAMATAGALYDRLFSESVACA